ncbi:MAG: hypothetical protein O3B02_06985 [Proteobacteria bacterium]|nr:hypothetical protein [Pseudomonadota bacterium]MDA1244731.1 hypothetical protein [Pseudomonadota bacterium]
MPHSFMEIQSTAQGMDLMLVWGRIEAIADAIKSSSAAVEPNLPA